MIFFDPSSLNLLVYLDSSTDNMNRRKGGKRGELWDELERNMKIERTKADAKLRGKSAPSEIVVRRLSAEADSKLTDQYSYEYLWNSTTQTSV